MPSFKRIVHFPASKNLPTSFFSQETTLSCLSRVASSSSFVFRTTKTYRSTKYACIPRGPSARPIHAAGSLRKWACFLSTSPLRILRIIMNEKKEEEEEEERKKRKERGKNCTLPGSTRLQSFSCERITYQDPCFARPDIE